MPFSFKNAQIVDTIEMIEKYRLDIRTVTMGISLLGCTRPTMSATCDAVYDRIVTRASRLVEVCEGIEAELGIPIVNKRISVTPISLIAAGVEGNPADLAQALNKAANEVGVNFIGGYSALVEKGTTEADRRLIESIPEALSQSEVVCGSVNIASSRAGINMDAARHMGEVIKSAAELSKDDSAIACAKLVVFANAVGDNPFMAGAFHGVEEPDCVVSVGVSGPGVVDRALGNLEGASLDQVAEEIKKAAFKITRAGQLVGNLASQRLGVPFGIVDLSLAPTAELGDSVAHILEHMGLEQVGTHGTTAALALLNDAVKKGGMMACSRVGGLSGSFIPVSEDKGMIDAVRAGSISMDKLEAMTAICSVGFDMIALPGATSAETIAGMIADEAAIGVMNHKTTAVRVIPVPGAAVGDEVDFGGLLGYAPIIPVNTVGNREFIHRGGFIPAPVHGFRN
ncbi:PFL family protein [Corynebacterium pseudodiphtheriticum]|uniref:PFL family protein n=1 Tax=Corynebacterium pseudodiphtheriticum TaxID=37637 RepID=UPI00254E96B7|nr:PFL family protein [Corynebacterium pseudodiphtheriticum]MDK8551319.1 PFL family protein [Corynebacterium pseudodiphtheriticum]MDK8562612.1 PFL family protein [Corynebacterium pseudodiphtheriticum]MDK8578690.1 PFL family protein [Corynebacterium pseudodiphtheriticum]MDK8582848.1 PFL family protein [Corynebacterium pseudodiphtheriticum]MDK8613840.1 PFL family protein [Corynebacterium pseudodiphtheriticum]